jgi:SAM-dependent methyltransferase
VVAERDIDRRRLAFGGVAELYDAARPAYPPAVIDELIDAAELEPGAQVLEVGAGTGKATRMLAERGLAVLALEPSAAMAAVARRNFASDPLVEIEQIDFEAWRPLEPLQTLVSAQAWHWIDPRLRYLRAGQALRSGGVLAAIWTLPVWESNELREELCEVYSRSVPELAADFPMHPAGVPDDLAGDWRAEIDGSDAFARPRVREHPWSCTYPTAAYLDLLQTHQDHILLAPGRKDVLLDAIAAVLDRAGASITMDYVTRLCLAERV